MRTVRANRRLERAGWAAAAGPWYRRRSFLLAVGVVVLVGLAVLSDLPRHTSRTAQISAGSSIVNQINSDIKPCAYAVGEAVMIESGLQAGTLSATDRHNAPGLLRDDQNACAFTDSAINDLANLEAPGSAAGNHLGTAVNIATIWASSDALGTIEAIQTLISKPDDASARSRMARFEQLMASDRAAALAQVAAAEKQLGVGLPPLGLPVVG